MSNESDCTILEGLSESEARLFAYIKKEIDRAKVSVLRGMHTGAKTEKLLERLVNALCGAEPVPPVLTEAIDYVRMAGRLHFSEDEVVVPAILMRTIIDEVTLGEYLSDAEREELRTMRIALAKDVEQIAIPLWWAHAIAYKHLACVGVHPDQPWYPEMMQFRATIGA